jgi:hypothetical protein
MENLMRSSKAKTAKRPSHDVFLVDGDGDKAFWTKIGAGWLHEDGDGFNLTLIAIPVTGRLVVRKAKPHTEADHAEA